MAASEDVKSIEIKAEEIDIVDNEEGSNQSTEDLMTNIKVEEPESINDYPDFDSVNIKEEPLDDLMEESCDEDKPLTSTDNDLKTQKEPSITSYKESIMEGGQPGIEEAEDDPLGNVEETEDNNAAGGILGKNSQLQETSTICKKSLVEKCLNTESQVETQEISFKTEFNDLKMSPSIYNAQNNFTCKFCLKIFQQKRYLRNHLICHREERPYSCEICENKFKHKSTLNSHIRIHTGEKPFSCELCQLKFKRRDDLQSHIRLHLGERPYSCDICKMKFTKTRRLVVHKRIHTGEKPFSCEFCQKAFSEKGNLGKHKRTHTGVKPYSCDLCEKKFSARSSLNNHLLLHTGEKNHSCKICKMKFSRKEMLLVHMRTHTGEKPYGCELCGKTFSQKSNLRKHILNVHIGKKSYVCQRGSLNNQLSTHSEDKEYSCKFCEKKFKTRDSFKSHILIHTSGTQKLIN